MAQFIITTTEEEQARVIKAVKALENKEVPVRVLAEEAGMSESRTRYALLDLIEAKKVLRVPSKAFNKHYIRYSYRLPEPSASNKI